MNIISGNENEDELPPDWNSNESSNIMKAMPSSDRNDKRERERDRDRNWDCDRDRDQEYRNTNASYSYSPAIQANNGMYSMIMNL